MTYILWRIWMYVATAAAAGWFALGVVIDEPILAIAVLGHLFIAAACWYVAECNKP